MKHKKTNESQYLEELDLTRSRIPKSHQRICKVKTQSRRKGVDGAAAERQRCKLKFSLYTTWVLHGEI